MRKLIYKWRLKILIIENNLKNKFLSKKHESYAIITSTKYKNKIKEDLILQKYFLKRKIPCTIVSWEEKNDSTFSIIRSVWGYHLKLKEFQDFLNNHKTIHSKEIILENMNKKRQYELLVKYDIPRIETKFYNDISELKEIKRPIVIKPCFSAAGFNTFKIEKKEDLKKCLNLKDFMVQPYIENISEGEISIIIINHEIKYGIIRYPGIFTTYQKESYFPIKSIPKKCLEIANKIDNLKEYKDTVLMRIDIIKDKKDFKILEVELVDPSLFIETIPDKKLKDEVYSSLVFAIIKESEKIEVNKE